jgi:hypothetical protein
MSGRVVLTADLIDYRIRRQVIEFFVPQQIEGRPDPGNNSVDTRAAMEALPSVPGI